MDFESLVFGGCFSAIISIIIIALGIALAPVILPIVAILGVITFIVVLVLVGLHRKTLGRTEMQPIVKDATSETAQLAGASQSAKKDSVFLNILFTALVGIAVFLATQTYGTTENSTGNTNGAEQNKSSIILDEKPAPQIVCNSEQCSYFGSCITRPTNSTCSSTSSEGWNCNIGFYKQNGNCAPYSEAYNECGDTKCNQTFPNSKFDHYDKSIDSCICDCKLGFQWNAGQTACGIPTPVVPMCTDSQCAFGGVCADKPLNSRCATDGINAWLCDEGFLKNNGQCVQAP
ncbi:MAG: hypothetical protein WCO25_03050 [Candidatus Uhrbacteria bacterium]